MSEETGPVGQFKKSAFQRKGGPAILTVADIAESALLHLIEEGRRPSLKTGLVQHGPCQGTTWIAVDQALKFKHRGLKGCVYSSLAELLDGEGVPKTKQKLMSVLGGAAHTPKL